MSSKTESGFEISMFGDLKFEKMTALIRYNDLDFAQIIIDDGVGNEVIDFIIDRPNPDAFEQFRASDVLEVFQQAIEKLREFE